MDNETLKIIHQRKSVRNYTAQKVETGALKTLLKSAMAAPSAKDLRPWSFIGITQREVLNMLSEKLPYGKMLVNAQAAIVVCGEPEKGVKNVRDYWVQDCSAATQNILLAAEAIGLGAVWIGVFPRDDRVENVKKILNIPENVFPLNVISIGYPAGDEKPKDKFDETNIHWETW